MRDARPDLSDIFVQAVERALDVDPERRYESAGAIEAALTRVVSASDATPASAETRTNGAWREAPAKWWTLWSVKVSAAAIVLAGAAAALVTSAPWRDRILGRKTPPPSQTATSAAAAGPSSVVVRRIPLSDFSSIGSPSPDGTLFSIADDSGNVAVLDVASGRLRQVTNDATYSPRASQFAGPTVISPDDQLVAYGWAALDGKYELRVVDLDGKHPRVLLRSDAIEQAEPLQWSHDGKSILATLMRPDHSVLLGLVSVAEGTARGVKDMGMVSPQYASLSPDGEFIVYDAPQSKGASARDIFIVRSNGSDDRRLVEHPANDAQPVWTADGRHVLFASDRSGSMDIWSVTVDGGIAQGEEQLVHRNVGRMSLRGLTDIGSYFYYLTAGTVEVYEADLAEGRATRPIALPTSYSGSNISSIWSADGRRLAYASRRGLAWFDRGSTTLAIRETQTHEQRDLAPVMKSFLVRAWSPDERYVLVQGTGPDGRQGAHAIDTTSARVSAVVVDGSSARPDWLPDGRIMYFNRSSKKLIARSVQTGAEQILFDPAGEGGDIVADIYGRGFRLSPDGQTLAFTTATQHGDTFTRSIIVKILPDGPSRELVRVPGPELIEFQDWTPDGTELVFTRWSPTVTEPVSLWRVPISGGDPQAFGLSTIGLRDVSVHPDGTKITFTAGWPTNELWVIENFLTDK